MMRESNLKEKAYAKIKENIISLAYAPGEFLNETQLSEEIGVSRTPVREALNHLEKENLVRVIPKRGVMVSEINIADIMDIYQVRELLEPDIIRLYAKSIDKLLLETIREKIISSQHSQLSYEEQYKIDSILHQVLLDANRNKYFAAVLGTVFDQNQRLRIMTARTIKERLSQTHIEHARIVDLLLADDYDAAADAMLLHLKQSCEASVQCMMRVQAEQ